MHASLCAMRFCPSTRDMAIAPSARRPLPHAALVWTAAIPCPPPARAEANAGLHVAPRHQDASCTHGTIALLTLAAPALPKAQEFPHVLFACVRRLCGVPITLSCARASGRKHGDKNGSDDSNANNPRSKEQEWTHWDLNPGPSACEADVIPLHHVPLAVRPRYAMQSLNGPTSEVVAAPARQLQPRAPSIPLNVAIAWKAEARRTERHFAPNAPSRAGSHARSFACWLLQACSCCDALRLWAVSTLSGPDVPTNMRRAMALCS